MRTVRDFWRALLDDDTTPAVVRFGRWLRRVFCLHSRYDGIGHCMLCGAPPIPCAICGEPYDSERHDEETDEHAWHDWTEHA